jgi:putative ABC transport system permease protein
MKAIPIVRAVRGGLSGRRVQAIVIGLVVFSSTAAATLALGLLADSSAPFDYAFAAQHGADVTATVTGASPAQLAATTRLLGVTASAGPFPQATVSVTAQLTPSIHVSSGGHAKATPAAVDQQLTLVGRSSPGGPVDDLTLTAGHWPAGPGQIVLSSSQSGLPLGAGSQVTVTGVPGSLKLTVVGIATSATGTAQGWVTPGEIATLPAAGTAEASQMLYRFASAGTTAAVNADIAAVTAALPHGSVLGAQSWLTAKALATASFAPWVPFIVAFGLIGLAMSALIVINVVGGAVVASTRRIGVLKSIGFSPPQVVAAYVLQVAVPAAIGCAAGVATGNLVAVPMLGQGAQAYDVGSLAVPAWVSLAVPLAMLGLVAVTAFAIALRAGQMSAVQAIATGRAPGPPTGTARTGCSPAPATCPGR